MTCVLRLRSSYGPQLQTLAPNKNKKGAEYRTLRLYFSEN